jgi:hypothetical protein
MKTLALLVLVACGGSQTKSISNETTKPPEPAKTESGEGKVVSRTQSGGVIELQGDRGQALDRANEEMAAHCGPGNYTITQEGEEAIDHDGSGSTTITTTAWRVHYQCAN